LKLIFIVTIFKRFYKLHAFVLQINKAENLSEHRLSYLTNFLRWGLQSLQKCHGVCAVGIVG
jgi:hypothetical protein